VCQETVISPIQNNTPVLPCTSATTSIVMGVNDSNVEITHAITCGLASLTEINASFKYIAPYIEDQVAA
jgi:hypothetical protein